MLKGISDKEAVAEPEEGPVHAGSSPPSFPRRPNDQDAGLCPHSARHPGDPKPFVSQRPKPTLSAQGRGQSCHVQDQGVRWDLPLTITDFF